MTLKKTFGLVALIMAMAFMLTACEGRHPVLPPIPTPTHTPTTPTAPITPTPTATPAPTPFPDLLNDLSGSWGMAQSQHHGIGMWETIDWGSFPSYVLTFWHDLWTVEFLAAVGVDMHGGIRGQIPHEDDRDFGYVFLWRNHSIPWNCATHVFEAREQFLRRVKPDKVELVGHGSAFLMWPEGYRVYRVTISGTAEVTGMNIQFLHQDVDGPLASGRVSFRDGGIRFADGGGFFLRID